MISRIELKQYRRLTDHHRRTPEARAFRRRLEEDLTKIPPVRRRVIVLRYCLRWSWIAVCTEMHYGEAQVYRLHQKALKALEELE